MKSQAPELDSLARNLVGDDKSPNLFFVSFGLGPQRFGVRLVTCDFDVAYSYWRAHADTRFGESLLEDRQHGTLASVEYDEETREYVEQDDTRTFSLRKSAR